MVHGRRRGWGESSDEVVLGEWIFAEMAGSIYQRKRGPAFPVFEFKFDLGISTNV
jgi:hypothetical protein